MFLYKGGEGTHNFFENENGCRSVWDFVDCQQPLPNYSLFPGMIYIFQSGLAVLAGLLSEIEAHFLNKKSIFLSLWAYKKILLVP